MTEEREQVPFAAAWVLTSNRQLIADA